MVFPDYCRQALRVNVADSLGHGGAGVVAQLGSPPSKGSEMSDVYSVSMRRVGVPGWGPDRPGYVRPQAPLDVARRINGLPLPERPLRRLVGLPEESVGRLCGLVAQRHERAVAARTGPGQPDCTPHWSARLGDWIDSRGLLRRYDRLVGDFQRSRRGWAESDLWSLDYHTCVMLAGAVRTIADLSFGWREELWPTHDEWVADLRRLADDLDLLADRLSEEGVLDTEDDEAVCDRVFAMLRKSVGHLRVD
jgi:hypothetical protein